MSLRDELVELMFRWRYGFGPGSKRPSDPEVKLDALDTVDKILALLDKQVVEARIDQTIKVKQIVFESETFGEALSRIKELEQELKS